MTGPMFSAYTNETAEVVLCSVSALPTKKTIGTRFCAAGRLRSNFQMAILKSGFIRAYMRGFANELAATQNNETVGKASGMMSGRFSTVSAVVM